MIEQDTSTVVVTLTVHTRIGSLDEILNHCSNVSERIGPTELDFRNAECGNTLMLTMHYQHDVNFESSDTTIRRVTTELLNELALQTPDEFAAAGCAKKAQGLFRLRPPVHDSLIYFAESCEVEARIDRYPYDLSTAEYEELDVPVSTEILPAGPNTLLMLHLRTKGVNGTGAGIVARSFVEWLRNREWLETDEINVEMPELLDSETLETPVFLIQREVSPEWVVEQLRNELVSGRWESMTRADDPKFGGERTHYPMATYILSTVWHNDKSTGENPTSIRVEAEDSDG
ncbi:hypothetical protein [Actinopolyspora saharensis]|uniref:hypothetical protein n=1 Tax=Actinopolyspora saharensis TaxID=995062 RepID=UPI003F67E2D8